MEFEAQRFPAGPFHRPTEITSEHMARWILVLDAFPGQLSALVEPLSREQTLWTYRRGGWNIRQVVHHCADSHMNSIIRFKLALTEDKPTIKPYFEDRWAELPDGNASDLSASLHLLKGLHARWVELLRNLNPEDFARTFHHPESDREIALDENTGLYAWHCTHHLAHIRAALATKGIPPAR